MAFKENYLQTGTENECPRTVTADSQLVYRNWISYQQAIRIPSPIASKPTRGLLDSTADIRTKVPTESRSTYSNSVPLDRQVLQ
jgi:hypothetical protein